MLSCEHNGLKTVASSTASFLENLAIVIVPMAGCVIEKSKPGLSPLLHAGAAVAGVGFLTLGTGGMSISGGYLFLLAAAGCYAAAIIVTARLSRRGDPFVMGFFQVATIGALVEGSYTLPQNLSQWGMVLALAIVCTGFGFTLQPVAQSRTSPEKAGLFCALSPLVAGLLGMLFMHEELTLTKFIGEVLILSALAVPDKLFRHRC